MKRPYRNKILKIKNINNAYKGGFNIRYDLFGIKFTIKNKAKIEFFKQIKIKNRLEKFNEYQKVLDELKVCRINKKPLLTVVILTYNHRSTIRKCIESVVNQNTKYDYLIKILDDASTDGTTDICFEYAQNYPEKIEYILQPFNTNIKHFFENVKKIDTKYWTFVDGDDWWLLDNKIEDALNFLENNPDYSTYCTDFIWNSNKRPKNFLRTIMHRTEESFTMQYDDKYIYIHPVARIHRNIIDWNKDYTNLRKSDITFLLLYLSRGKAFVDNTQISGIYNVNSKGLWQSRTANERNYASSIVNYTISRALKYEYDDFFARRTKTPNYKMLKKIFGKAIAWKLALFINKRHYIKEEQKNMRKNIISKYKKIEKDYRLIMSGKESK